MSKVIEPAVSAVRWVVGGALLLAMGLASAQTTTTTFIVDSLAAGVADANIGDGLCQTADGDCSLRAALEEANALPAPVAPTDDIRIEFDPSLDGKIPHSSATFRMSPTAIGVAFGEIAANGAFYLVDAARPLTIDFDNRVGLVQNGGDSNGMIHIASDDVTLENFQNDALRDVPGAGVADMAGIVGGDGSIIVDGSRVTLRNGLVSDPGSTVMDTCIAVLDGVTDLTVEDFYCRSARVRALLVDRQASVSNVTLNRFETQGGQGTDILVDFGATDVKTVVNGMTITDSEFRSRANQGTDYTIGIRENSVISNLVISGSRFIAANTRSIGVFPTAQVDGLTVENSTVTDTSLFLFDNAGVPQSGYEIRGNTFTSVQEDVILLTSPHSGAVIEDNQFIDSRGTSLVAGVRVDAGAFGSNNVIRDNAFEQATPVNRFAIWMRANPGVDLPTGWALDNNFSDNIVGTGFAPISLFNNGNTPMRGNTFGAGSRGSTEAETESGTLWFVNNNDAGTNDRIQPWRPTGAVYTGTTVRVRVEPVTDPEGSNTEPTTPVSIDVYYTETDKAETYLGRIPGTHAAATVFEFTSTATGGAVRAQITDAEGRSSQYSAAQEVVLGVDAGADDDMDGLPNGAECLIDLLGIPLVCRDTDNDGTPDYLDTDDDNDGIPTSVECPTGSPCLDTDDDGTPNNRDLDSDNDGITDAQECPEQACRDTDGDGAPNYIDLDSDGDGMNDDLECPDGVPCSDADANGIEDYLEPPAPVIVRGTGGGATGLWMLALLGGLALLRRRAMLPLVGLLGLLGATAAQAADDDRWTSRLYGGAMVGALFTDFDEAGLTAALQGAGFAVDPIEEDSDKLGYGLWLGYALTSALGLELAYTTGADERVAFAGAVGSDLQGALEVASPFLEGYGDSYLLRLRYHHELNERWFLSPHIGVGMTQTRQTLESRDQTARLKEDTFTWAVGSGIHYALNRDWSVGVAADYYQSASDNAYGVVSGVLEWRFPKALPSPAAAPVPAIAPTPVRVVEPIAAAPEPAPAPAAPAPLQLSDLSLQGLTFALNGDQLTAESRALLDGVLPDLRTLLDQSPTLQVEVAGHTDATGSAALNQRLSQSRADAVVDYLTAKGVDGARLMAVGHGSSAPAATNDTAEGRAQNRRVELRAAP